MKSARAGSERFFSGQRVQKWRNPVCTRKRYAASVSQLALAYGCGIFPTFEPARIGKKIRYPAVEDLIRGSLVLTIKIVKHKGCYRRNVQLVLYDQFD